MFKAERIQKIKEVVYNRKQVDVTTLSSLLNVSGVTIRSDLERLEKSGFLLRTHGGAILNETSTSQDDANNVLLGKTIQYDKNKESIGMVASALIEEHEWIFLGPGETCYYIAKQLSARKNINVLTNNVYVMNTLLHNPQINVIVAGGNLNHRRCCTTGDIFVKSVEDFYIRKAFFSISGADFQAGYTVPDEGEMNLIKSVSKKSGELVYLINSRNFGSISFVSVGGLQSASAVISDNQMPEAYKKYFFENKIRVFTSYDLDSLV
ncbi:MAG: DeoR/GlpR family DNA-binding transcription regulator [Spirochaetaceae bacterium]|jgi:DeoR/GlpR family transcriptional regulator of sugar metabolism|nr:DeoR/GlpR family DNA-binding transcription regulator [Spirochaetaceae bacterium]